MTWMAYVYAFVVSWHIRGAFLPFFHSAHNATMNLGVLLQFRPLLPPPSLQSNAVKRDRGASNKQKRDVLHSRPTLGRPLIFRAFGRQYAYACHSPREKNVVETVSLLSSCSRGMIPGSLGPVMKPSMTWSTDWRVEPDHAQAGGARHVYARWSRSLL